MNKQERQHERLMAYSNGNLLANCEECGQPIPLELSRCTECAEESIRRDADLQSEIDRKVAINRARKWGLDGSGHGYHVREKVSA